MAFPCKQCTTVVSVLLCVQTVEGKTCPGHQFGRVCCHATPRYPPHTAQLSQLRRGNARGKKAFCNQGALFSKRTRWSGSALVVESSLPGGEDDYHLLFLGVAVDSRQRLRTFLDLLDLLPVPCATFNCPCPRSNRVGSWSCRQLCGHWARSTKSGARTRAGCAAAAGRSSYE